MCLINAVTGEVAFGALFYAMLVNFMNREILKYASGEEILKGDRVIFHGKPAEIELAACDPKDPEADWYLKEYGGGVMIVEPTVFGRAFIPAAQLDGCELEFVSRAGGE